MTIRKDRAAIMAESQEKVQQYMETSVLHAVVAAYGLGAVHTPPIRQGGAINHVLLVSTDLGNAIVRVHRPETVAERLMAVHQVQERLRREGLPIPSIWRTRDNSSWISVDDRLVEVISFVPDGHEVGTWDDAAVLFSQLGRFHAAIREIDPVHLSPPVHACYVTPETGLILLKTTEHAFRTERGNPAYPLAAEARRSTELLLRRLQVARQIYEESLPQTLIHGDFVGNNVLIDGRKVVAILDFDRLAVRHRVYEVAYVLMYVLSRLVRTGVRTPTSDHSLTDDDIAHIAHLLVRYRDESSWDPTSAEMLALPFEMARAPLYPVVAAGLIPQHAMTETLNFANHLPLAHWLVDHATMASRSLHERMG